MEALKNRTFRPTAENQERLKYAEQAGLNVSELINEALAKSARQIIEAKTRKLREVLNAPVP